MLLGTAIFFARPAYRGTTRVLQPDGTSVSIRLVGDEYLHYNTTSDGYSLVRRDDGAYVYARLSAVGELEPTTMLAHDESARTAEERGYLKRVGRLRPQLTAEAEQMRRQNRAQRARQLSQNKANLYDYSKFRGLVLLVEYNDCSFRYDNYTELMEEMINADNYTGNSRTNITSAGIRCTGSIRDYYRDNSNGLFVPTFDVVGPVKVNRSQYYVNSSRNATQLMIDACTAADSKVNFKDYDVDGDGMVDMIYFIFAGLGSYIQGNDSRLLWPHQSDISWRGVRKDGVYLGRYACSNELFGSTDWSVLEGIGTMCHEFSHVLGLPDFYDTGNLYKEDECVTPDSWSVMANGADYNYGRTPCCFSLFERYALGFAAPQVISEAGSYRIEALHASNAGYRLNTPVKKESFYIENRQKGKWDSQLPGHGMLIFRVDSTNTDVWEYTNSVNDDPDHPYYELLRAGGVRSDGYSVSIGSATDPFPGTRRVTTINNETSPSLKTWAGKPNNLGLRSIKESSGVITFEAYDVDVLTSVSFSSETYKLTIGTQLQLVTVLDPETATCTLTFASDNESVATVDAGGLLSALSEGTAHITVTANDRLTATCTVVVSTLSTVPDIASFRSMDEGDDALLTLTGAQVLYVHGDNIYLRDASGSLLLSGTNLKVSRGDVLNGSILGRLSHGNRMPQLTPTEGESEVGGVTVSSGETPLPTEVFGWDLTADRYGDMVLVRGLTLVRDGGVFAVIGDRRVRLWNMFQIKSPKISLPTNISGKFFDVTAVYGTDVVDGQVIDELYLLQSPVEGEDPDAITAPLAGKPAPTGIYNLSGQRVGPHFRGIVVEDGRKVLRK